MSVDPSALRPSELAQLVRSEQARRWRTGERILLEPYLDRYPALRSEVELLLDLVLSEAVLREQQGESPDSEEYARRFPDHADALRRHFELRRNLSSSLLATAPSDATRPGLLGRLHNWLARPERIRDAGVLQVFLGLLALPFLVGRGWEFVASFLPGSESQATVSGFAFTLAAVCMQLWLGFEIIGKQLWAIWAGLALRLTISGMALLMAYQRFLFAKALGDLGFQDGTGVAVQGAALLAGSPGSLGASVLFHLLPILACLAALYAYYASAESEEPPRPSVPAKVVVLLLFALLLVSGARQAIRNSASPADLAYVGGASLVFDLDRTAEPAQNIDPGAIARILQGRCQALGLRPVVLARPLGEGQLEIVLRGGGEGRDDAVRLVKAIARSRSGLEFLILANLNDDAPAMVAARAQISDPEAEGALRRAARLGIPPPPPRSPDEDGTFPVRLGGRIDRHAYRWVALGPFFLRELGLDDRAERRPLREALAAARTKREATLADGYGTEWRIDQGFPTSLLFWSREVANREQPLGKEGDNQVEYFVLAREPEEGETVTGRNVAGAFPDTDSRSQRPVVRFQLDPEGGERFSELTNRNAPTRDQGIYRRLAIVLEGQVVNAPSINSRIGALGIITGNYSPQEVDHLVRMLQLQPLPVRLNPVPVQETTFDRSVW